MRRLAVGVFCLGLSLAVGTDFAGFYLTGRYENQASALSYGGSLSLLDLNKLRLDMEAGSSGRLRLDAAAWLETPHGATVYDVAGQLPDWVADSLPDSLKSMLAVRLGPRVVLDRAYATAELPFLRLKVGKQPLAWGVGYVWNPTEVVAAKSFIDPTYDREGINALRLDMNWRGQGLQLMMLPEKDLQNSGYIARVVGNLLGVDWSATGTRRVVPLPAFGVTMPAYSAGGQFKGELFGPGIWAEGAYWWPDSGDGFYRLCAGADYTLGTRTYFLLEYFRNGPGRAGSDEYTVDDWLRRVAGVSPGLGRDYLFGSAMQPVLGFHQAGMSVLANLADRSVILIPSVYLGLGDNVDLQLFGTIPLGSGPTEFASGRGAGGSARLSVYF